MQPDDKISKRWGVDLRKSNDPFDWLLNAELYIALKTVNSWQKDPGELGNLFYFLRLGPEFGRF